MKTTLEAAPRTAAGTVSIRTVESKKDLSAFVEFAWRIYAGDAAWVPPLKMEVKEALSDKNPFWLQASRALFLAERGGEVVGRIAAIENRAHNRFHGDKVGFFGFFECVNDSKAAAALFEAASAWLKKKGLDVMRGPVSPSMGEECGVLIEGLGVPAAVMMAYNPPYYKEILEASGFKKAKDLYAWWIGTDAQDSERVIRIVDRIRRKNRVTLRPIRMNRFKQELELVKKIYNAAWEKNWGFVPMSEEEIDYTAKKLKPILVPEMVQFVEQDGRVIAMGVTLPDVNQAIKPLNGSLNPINIVRLLWGLRKVNQARMYALGILPEFRKTGIDALLYMGALNGARKLGWRGGEMSWTLEDNFKINQGIEALGGRRYKTYRIYDRLT